MTLRAMILRAITRWTCAFIVIAGLAISGPGMAYAAPVTGTLLIFPGASSDTAPMKVFTSGGCPDLATGYYTRVRGHGFPAGGVVVSTPTDAGMSHVGGFYAYFRETMRDYAKDAGTTLSGRYEITVYCVDDLDTHYAEYTGVLQFTKPTGYVAVGAARPTGTAAPIAASPVPQRVLVVPSAASPTASGSPQAARSDRGLSPHALLYVGLGAAALAVLVIVFKYGQRSALRSVPAPAASRSAARPRSSGSKR